RGVLGDPAQVDVLAQRLAAGVDAEDLLPAPGIRAGGETLGGAGPRTAGGGTKPGGWKVPGRSRAESSFSSRFDAAITTMFSLASKPSISTRSWFRVWSRSPETSLPRGVPTASSSSMKRIAGALSRASLKRRRIRAAPRPANISTNEEADWLKRLAPDSWATAFSSIVLPAPGGTCRRR